MHACQLTRDLAGDVAALVIVLVALVLFETLATPQLYYIASAVMYQYSWPIQVGTECGPRCGVVAWACFHGWVGGGIRGRVIDHRVLQRGGREDLLDNELEELSD
eukprot:364132-Chlamydomonas_euryale.AAC.2